MTMDWQQLEQLVWQELDALAVVALKAQKRALSLPLGLLQLRPPRARGSEVPKLDSICGTPADHGLQPAASSQHAHWGAASAGSIVESDPAWPGWRRAQRLSYALASVFTDVSCAI